MDNTTRALEHYRLLEHLTIAGAMLLFGIQTLLASGFTTLALFELWGFSAVVCFDSKGSLVMSQVGIYCFAKRRGIWSVVAWVSFSLVIGTNLYYVTLYQKTLKETDFKVERSQALEENTSRLKIHDMIVNNGESSYEMVMPQSSRVENDPLVDWQVEVSTQPIKSAKFLYVSTLLSVLELLLIISTIIFFDDSHFSCSFKEMTYSCYGPQRISFSVGCALILSILAVFCGIVVLLLHRSRQQSKSVLLSKSM